MLGTEGKDIERLESSEMMFLRSGHGRISGDWLRSEKIRQELNIRPLTHVQKCIMRDEKPRGKNEKRKDTKTSLELSTARQKKTED